MRIACVANINNMMFILCRYLRDEGFDAELITLADEPAHFSPSADDYTEDFLSYYTVLPFTKSTIYKPEGIDALSKKLSEFDFYIGSDIAPALLTLTGKKLDVFIPHGSDIYALPFVQKRSKQADKVWWLREKTMLGKLQKIGIEHVSTILFPDEYDIHFPFKNKLKTGAIYHNTSGPMVYIPQYENLLENAVVKTLPNYAIFAKIRLENDLVIFSHSRHNGFNLPENLAIHQKGNDVLIHGFADFVQHNPLIKSKLILFDYGMDIAASKTLIASLSLDSHVIWMPLMQRKEIMLGLNMADLSCGQFDNSWLTCGVVNETLASNKPLLHFREDALYTKDYNWLYPLLNARTPIAISEAICDYLDKKAAYKSAAEKGSEWLYEFTVKQPIAIIRAAIFAKNGLSSALPKVALESLNNLLRDYYRKDKYLRLSAKLKNYLRRKSRV